MPHKNHNYEKESEKFYDNIAQHFDHSFDGFLASFFKKFIVKHLEVPKMPVFLISAVPMALFCPCSVSRQIFRGQV